MRTCNAESLVIYFDDIFYARSSVMTSSYAQDTVAADNVYALPAEVCIVKYP